MDVERDFLKAAGSSTVTGKVLDLYLKGRTVKQITNHHSLLDSGISEAQVKLIIEQHEKSPNRESPKKETLNNIQEMARKQAMLLVRTELDPAPEITVPQSPGSPVVITESIKAKIRDLHQLGKSAKQIAAHYTLADYKVSEEQIQQVVEASSSPHKLSHSPKSSNKAEMSPNTTKYDSTPSKAEKAGARNIIFSQTMEGSRAKPAELKKPNDLLFDGGRSADPKEGAAAGGKTTGSIEEQARRAAERTIRAVMDEGERADSGGERPGKGPQEPPRPPPATAPTKAALVRPDRHVFGSGEPERLLQSWARALEGTAA